MKMSEIKGKLFKTTKFMNFEIKLHSYNHIDDTFDAVVSLGLFYYMKDEEEALQVLKEMIRITKPGIKHFKRSIIRLMELL
jgi:cyclopropane fatty-acyl-phospholipid synthase-like methyltransferase